MAASGISAPTRPRKERAGNAAKRRRQIIEATIRSVVRNGLAGTTLATVSAEAGLSQGVAVFYFKNKQTLLGEVLRHQYEIYQEAWQRGLAQAGGKPIDRVIALIRAAAAPPKFRRATKPSRGARQRRLDGKRRQGDIKKDRGRVSRDD